MITRNFDVNVNIPEPISIPTIRFGIVQNDKNVYGLTIRVMEETIEINYSQIASATITFAKPDGNVVQGNMTVGADSLTYTMGTNEISYPGMVTASIQLFGTSGERLTTSRFKFEVSPDLITPSAVQSSSEFPVLQQVIAAIIDQSVVAVDGLSSYNLDLAVDRNFTIEFISTNPVSINFLNIPVGMQFTEPVCIKVIATVVPSAVTYPEGSIWQEGMLPIYLAGKTYYLYLARAGAGWHNGFSGAW